MLFKKNRPEVYEGVRAEEYKKLKNKWIRLAVVGTGVPFVLGVLVSIFNGTFSLLNLFGNGEVVLFLFSLNLPMAFDLFDMKNRDDERLDWAFWWCVIIVCLQVALYCLIRSDESTDGTVKSIFFSGVMLIASWGNCVNAIRAMFQHSIAENGGENNVER